MAQRADERDDMADEVEALKLELEDMQRRWEAESLERNRSHAQILEEREGREVIEDDLNTVRDKPVAAHIEIQQKEDEIEMKNGEIKEFMAEH